MLAPHSWRHIAAWICGWLYTVGNITITLAVNFGTALFLVGCIGVFENSAGEPIYEATTWQMYLIFFAITVLCNLISALGNRWLPILDVISLLPHVFFSSKFLHLFTHSFASDSRLTPIFPLDRLLPSSGLLPASSPSPSAS